MKARLAIAASLAMREVIIRLSGECALRQSRPITAAFSLAWLFVSNQVNRPKAHVDRAPHLGALRPICDVKDICFSTAARRHAIITPDGGKVFAQLSAHRCLQLAPAAVHFSPIHCQVPRVRFGECVAASRSHLAIAMRRSVAGWSAQVSRIGRVWSTTRRHLAGRLQTDSRPSPARVP